MPGKDLQANVLNILKDLPEYHSTEPLKELFWSYLNYERKDQSFGRAEWSEKARDALAENPILFATAGVDEDFHVIYCKLASNKLQLGQERIVINQLLKEHPYSLFVFSNENLDYWHFVNVKLVREKDDDDNRNPKLRRLYRRITVGEYERLRTASERISMLNTEFLSTDLFGISPVTLQEKHDDAFDVEKVGDEFYKQYESVFYQVEELIQGISDEEQRRLFTQKLFNRLMFIAFIQKKEWMKFNSNPDYLNELWKNYKASKTVESNIYDERLKVLFFSALNNPNDVNLVDINRGGFLKQLIGDVRYLNGGLFEKEDDDCDERIVIPDKCIETILNRLFNRFNFTITESTPLDIEVAIDPEMLGIIFERLVTGRKESGSYYTPKSIVTFMCKEALKGYLKGYNDLVDKHSVEGISVKEARKLLSQLRKIKVCDPACGSGAYFMGMLHEIHYVTSLLDTRIDELSALDDYRRKLDIIQNNIYGVDIDTFAINIARLRLWLSLVVDYEGDKPEPLPNLDFKIEVGDSLISPNPQTFIGQTSARDKLVRDFQKAKAEFMQTHNRGEKIALRRQIDELREQIADWTHAGNPIDGFDWVVEFAEVFLSQSPRVTITGEFNLGDQLASKPIPGGFDVVIANPPYIQLQKNGGKLADLYQNKGYKTFKRTGDIYCLFYERGCNLLKEGGYLCYITSNKWMRAGYGDVVRGYLSSKNPIKLIDFSGFKNFDATVDTNIIILQNSENQGHTEAVHFKNDFKKDDSILDYFNSRKTVLKELTADTWFIGSSAEISLKKKIEERGTPLKDWDVQIYYGIKTGCNEAFIIDEAKRAELIARDPKSAEIIKPILRGRDIKRYGYEFAGLYLIATFPALHIDIDEYPAVRDYLKSFGKKIHQTGETFVDENGENQRSRKLTSSKWYETQDNIAYYPEFEKEKVVYPVISSSALFNLDQEMFFINDKAFMIVGEHLVFIISVLNSNITHFYLKMSSSPLGDAAVEYRKIYLALLPIPPLTTSNKALANRLESLVNRILSARRTNPRADTSSLESEIDQLVYQLYDLTDEEIRIIEESKGDT